MQVASTYPTFDPPPPHLLFLASAMHVRERSRLTPTGVWCGDSFGAVHQTQRNPPNISISFANVPYLLQYLRVPSPFPYLQSTFKIHLFYKPIIARLKRLSRPHKLKVEPMHKQGYQLGHLEQADVLANARSRAEPKRHVVCIHR